ncbi:hypothetical protein ACRAWF_23240 [Streptomyces sp. L7]
MRPRTVPRLPVAVLAGIVKLAAALAMQGRVTERAGTCRGRQGFVSVQRSAVPLDRLAQRALALASTGLSPLPPLRPPQPGPQPGERTGVDGPGSARTDSSRRTRGPTGRA